MERYIGCAGDNQFEERVFAIQNVYRGKDLTSGYTFLMQVRRPDEEESFLDLLDVEYGEDKIFLTWHIKRHDVEVAGDLSTQLLIQNSDDDIVRQTFVRGFLVGESLDATKSAEAIPPSIYEQAVAEATEQASLSKQYADEARALAESISSESEPLYTADKPDIVFRDELANYLQTESDPVYEADKPTLALKEDLVDFITEETDPIYTLEKPTLALKTDLVGLLSTESDPIYLADKPDIAFKSDLVGLGGGIGTETDPVYTAEKPMLALKSELADFLTSETDPLYSADKPNIALKSDLNSFIASESDPVYLADKPSLALKTDLASFITTEADPVYLADKPNLALKSDLTPLATKSEVNAKQDALTAGANITIVGNVISASGGGAGTVTEAPDDGQQYARQNEAWSVVKSAVLYDSLGTNEDGAITQKAMSDILGDIETILNYVTGIII